MQKVVYACSVVVGFVLLNVAHAAPGAKLIEVLQLGYAECKSAHVLRRKDLPLSKQTYARYLAIKDQVAELDGTIFTSGNPDVSRVVDYCDTVGRDIARSEALPIIQQGIETCGVAAKSIQGGDLDAARKALAQYDEFREQAVELAPAVLEVYSVMAGVRRCERVATEIENLFQQQQEVAAQLDDVIGHLDGVLATCEAIEVPGIEVPGIENEMVVAEVEDFVVSAAALENTVNSLQEQLAASQQALAETLGEELLADESLAGSGILAATAEIREAIAACHTELIAAIADSSNSLTTLNAEQEKRQAAQAEAEKVAAGIAAREAEQLARQQETPEQRRERLQENAASYTLVKRVVPKFPGKALRADKDGYVLVEYTIGVDGSVIDPIVIESKPGRVFNKAALKAISQWEYESGFAESTEPEVALMRTRINFQLQ